MEIDAVANKRVTYWYRMILQKTSSRIENQTGNTGNVATSSFASNRIFCNGNMRVSLCFFNSLTPRPYFTRKGEKGELYEYMITLISTGPSDTGT